MPHLQSGQRRLPAVICMTMQADSKTRTTFAHAVGLLSLVGVVGSIYSNGFGMPHAVMLVAGVALAFWLCPRETDKPWRYGLVGCLVLLFLLCSWMGIAILAMGTIEAAVFLLVICVGCVWAIRSLLKNIHTRNTASGI